MPLSKAMHAMNPDSFFASVCRKFILNIETTNAKQLFNLYLSTFFLFFTRFSPMYFLCPRCDPAITKRTNRKHSSI